jgi:hypothetical protein
MRTIDAVRHAELVLLNESWMLGSDPVLPDVVEALRLPSVRRGEMGYGRVIYGTPDGRTVHGMLNLPQRQLPGAPRNVESRGSIALHRARFDSPEEAREAAVSLLQLADEWQDEL